ncbi:MAG: hypothetical protein GY777_18375 [Candidatus Brocadiaceae bacterium]|nr:hypothetical protein [Candidatus Brocadiaceae bacterium]
MKNSLKGALLSGLVFPGIGQLVQKNYVRGIALILASTAGLIIMGVKVYRQTLTILEAVDLKGGVINLSETVNNLSQASSASSSASYRCAMILLMICWVIGTIDAYMVGRKKDLGLCQE